ncbi:MAG: DUF4203 domain-containing protein [Planctomycetes bacterium]|nr:TMEM198/TM7SF3 family protein [Phycisphaerae bacterium]NBB95907.1 DUF4203 domain-containing protein [Planctomycetota bacterium]
MLSMLAQTWTQFPQVDVPYGAVYAAATLLIAWGAILCLWGFRLFRVMLAVYGFLFGAATLGMVGQTFGGSYGAAGGAVAGGVAGAILSYFFMYIWVFLLGAACGVGMMLATGLAGTWVLWLLMFAMGLLFGVLALRHVRALTVVLTSVAGAGQIVWGVMLVLGVEVTEDLLAANDAHGRIASLFAKYHLAVVCWFAVAVLSATWQYTMSCRQEAVVRAEEDERKQKIADLPQTGSPLPPRAMQALYEGRMDLPGPKTHVPYIRIALAAVYLLLAIWGAYYEYRVQGLIEQAAAKEQTGDLAAAQTATARVVEEYPLSFGFIEARAKLLDLQRRTAAEEPRPQHAEPAPMVSQFVTRIHYWLPLFGCAGAGAAAMGVFLTRLKRPFIAIVAGIVAGAASFGVVVQLQAYDIQLLSQLKPISKAVLAQPTLLYLATYGLMFIAALLTLTPIGRYRRKRI